MADYVQVSTATETEDEAVRIAASAVQGKLAAGAQIVGPVVSVFWHAGEYGEGEEWQLLLKTTTARYAELEALVIREHSWEKPEVCATPIIAGATDYLAWLDKSTPA